MAIAAIAIAIAIGRRAHVRVGNAATAPRDQHSILWGCGLCGAAVSAARCAGETPAPQRLFPLLNDPDVATSSPVLLIAAAVRRPLSLSLNDVRETVLDTGNPEFCVLHRASSIQHPVSIDSRYNPAEMSVP